MQSEQQKNDLQSLNSINNQNLSSYQPLSENNNQKNNINITTMIQNSLPKQIQQDKKIKKSKRFLVFDQLYNSQKNYLRDLNLIEDKIHKPWLQNKLITQQQNISLFCYLSSFIQLSTVFVQTMKKIYQNWNQQQTMIGKQILYFNNYFKVYQDYCSKYQINDKIVQRIKKNQKSQNIIKQLPIKQYQTYLIKPIQRPLKYHLLLKQYKKATQKYNPQHKDIIYLKQAIMKYQQVNNKNNQFLQTQSKNKFIIQLDKKYHLFNNDKIFPLLIQSFQPIQSHSVSIDSIPNYFIHIFQNQIIFQNKIKNNIIKLELNSNSFIETIMDGKTYNNKIFLCSIKVSVHLEFKELTVKNRFYKIVKKQIKLLYEKEWDRKEIFMNKLAKDKEINQILTLTYLDSQQYQDSQFYQPHPKITTYCITPQFNQITFKFSVPYPNSTFQFITLPLYQFFEFTLKLKSLYPILQEFYFQTDHKFKSQQIQQIIPISQEFINYIFRDEKIIFKDKKMILDCIQVNKELWKLLTLENYQCNCLKCQKNFNYQHQTNQNQNRPKNKLNQYKNLIIQEYKQYFTIYDHLCQWSNYSKNQAEKLQNNYKKCIFFLVSLQKSISLLNPNQIKLKQNKLIYLQSYYGLLDPLILPSNLLNCNIEIQVYLPSNDGTGKPVKVKVNKSMTVKQIKSIVARKLNLGLAIDFSLILCYEKGKDMEKIKILHSHQKIMNIIPYLLSKDSSNQFSNQTKLGSTFSQKLQFLKQKCKQRIKEQFYGVKYKIYFLKTIFLPLEQQMQSLIFQNQNIKIAKLDIYCNEILNTLSKDLPLLNIDNFQKINILASLICSLELWDKKIQLQKQKINKELSISYIKKNIKNFYVQEFLKTFNKSKQQSIILQLVQKNVLVNTLQIKTKIIIQACSLNLWGRYYFDIHVICNPYIVKSIEKTQKEASISFRKFFIPSNPNFNLSKRLQKTKNSLCINPLSGQLQIVNSQYKNQILLKYDILKCKYKITHKKLYIYIQAQKSNTNKEQWLQIELVQSLVSLKLLINYYKILLMKLGDKNAKEGEYKNSIESQTNNLMNYTSNTLSLILE